MWLLIAPSNCCTFACEWETFNSAQPTSTIALCLVWRCSILSRLSAYSASRQSGWGSPWLVLMLVSDSSIIREEVMSPGRSYSSRCFVDYIRKFLSPFFPLPPARSFVRIFTFSYSLVLSVDIQRASALIEVMFWLQIVLIRHRSRTQLLFHLGRRNWLKNESNALRSLVTRPPAKRMNRVRFRNYRYGKGKSPREESAEKFRQVKSSLRKQTALGRFGRLGPDFYEGVWKEKKERVLVVSISVK